MKGKKIFIILLMITLILITINSALAVPSWCVEKPCNDDIQLIKETADAKIDFIDNITSTKNANQLKDEITISKNKISIDSKLNHELNVPAVVTFYNTGLSNPSAYHNGNLVKNMLVINNLNDSYTLFPTSWSEWTLEDTNWNGTLTNTTIRNTALEEDSDFKLYMTFSVENDSTNVIDDSAEEHNGTFVGTPLWSRESPREYSFQTNDSTAYGTFQNNNQINGLNETDHSFSFWINTNGTNAQNIIRKFTGGSPGAGYLINIDSNGNLKLNYRGDIANMDVQTSSPVNDSLWHHIVINLNSSNTRGTIFMDGVLQDTDTTVDGLLSHTGAVGYLGFTSATAEMKMDDFRMMNRTLSDAEITSLAQGNDLTDESNNVLFYKFTENDTSTIIEDYSGNEYNGTISGDASPVRGGVGTSYGSYTFDGTSEAINLGTDTDFKPQGVGFSFGTWFKTTTSQDGSYHMLMRQRTTGWGFNFNTTGLFEAFIEHTGGSEYIVTSNATATTLNDGNWHYAILSYNGTNTTLFLDGIKEISQDSAGTPLTILAGTDNVMLARDGDVSNGYFDGSLSESFVFHRDTNDDEALALYNSPQNLLYINSGYTETYCANNTFAETEGQSWFNVSYNGTNCGDINGVNYRTSNLQENLTLISFTASSWNGNNCVATFNDLTARQGICIETQIMGNDTSNETFSLLNKSFDGIKYYIPTLSNLQISSDTVFDYVNGSALVSLNDTDSMIVDVLWYEDDVNIENQSLTSVSNGSTVSLSYLPRNTDSQIYYKIQINNTLVLSDLNLSGNVTPSNLTLTNLLPLDGTTNSIKETILFTLGNTTDTNVNIDIYGDEATPPITIVNTFSEINSGNHQYIWNELLDGQWYWYLSITNNNVTQTTAIRSLVYTQPITGGASGGGAGAVVSNQTNLTTGIYTYFQDLTFFTKPSEIRNEVIDIKSSTTSAQDLQCLGDLCELMKYPTTLNFTEGEITKLNLTFFTPKFPLKEEYNAKLMWDGETINVKMLLPETLFFKIKKHLNSEVTIPPLKTGSESLGIKYWFIYVFSFLFLFGVIYFIIRQVQEDNKGIIIIISLLFSFAINGGYLLYQVLL